jgi:predicted RNase H-like HicB family nuclease
VTTTRDLVEKARELAARNYSTAVYRNEEGSGDASFLAKNPELYGCMAQGATVEAAVASLREARVDYIYSLLEDGLTVPAPAPAQVPAALTDDTETQSQVTLKKTVDFSSESGATSSPVESRPLYEVSVT